MCDSLEHQFTETLKNVTNVQEVQKVFEKARKKNKKIWPKCTNKYIIDPMHGEPFLKLKLALLFYILQGQTLLKSSR